MALFKGIWRRSDYYFQDSSLYLIRFSWKFLDKPVIPIPYRYNLSIYHLNTSAPPLSSPSMHNGQ